MSSPGVLDIMALLAPIPGESPAGSDLRASRRSASSFAMLKQARTAARTAERKVAVAEDDSQGLRPNWRPVHELATKVLSDESKDLEVAAYLDRGPGAAPWVCWPARRFPALPGSRGGVLGRVASVAGSGRPDRSGRRADESQRLRDRRHAHRADPDDPLDGRELSRAVFAGSLRASLADREPLRPGGEEAPSRPGRA